MICKTDNSSHRPAGRHRTVYRITLDGSFVGDLVVGKPGGC
jgi:hypothetical protein